MFHDLDGNLVEKSIEGVGVGDNGLDMYDGEIDDFLEKLRKGIMMREDHGGDEKCADSGTGGVIGIWQAALA